VPMAALQQSPSPQKKGSKAKILLQKLHPKNRQTHVMFERLVPLRVKHYDVDLLLTAC
jgi:hypothetical protein